MAPLKKPVQQGRRPSTGASTRIYSRENVSRYSERARQKRRGKRIKRGIICAVLAVLLGGAGVAGAWVMRVSSNLSGNGYINNNLLQTLVDTKVEDPFFMLLLGTDGRPGEDTYRSDSIILARIDPKEKTATLISIPRDTKVKYGGSTMKINAVHSIDGPEGMVKAVNELCNVKIAHYAEVDFDGMKQLIDAVGGIDINVPEGDGVDDPEAGPVVIESGQQHMDGEAALTFSRARHQFVDGDYTRMRHQRMVLGALAKQILNNVDPGNLVSLVDQLSQMVITDLGVQDIVSLVNSMRGMDTDAIYSANLPSWAGEDTMINGQSYVFVDEDALVEMMDRVKAGEDPQGPQTMSDGSGLTDNQGGTIADLSANGSKEWSSGTASTSSSSDSEKDSSSESGSSSE